MKRIRSLFILTVGLLCALLLFSGCSKTSPIVFNSILSINTNESGSRTITASADKATIKSILGSKNSSFQSFIDAYCPESIDWDYVETGSSYELTFIIGFQTLDEYQEKLGSLTGNPAGVTISRPQVGVKTGFTLTENTKITDLFTWLFSALSERSGQSLSKLQDKLISGSNLLIYAGREYPQEGTGLYAYIETLHDAECIDILTDITLDNTWTRSVHIRFPGKMLDNASNVKPYLSSLLPTGITEKWTSDTIWSLTFESGDIKKTGSLMDGLFQAQTDAVLTETMYADNSMRFTHRYQEPLNLAFFVPNTGKTLVRYFVKTPDNAVLYISNGSDGLTQASSLSNDYAGYTCLFSQSMSGGTLDFTASYQYQPLEIVVDTQVHSVQDIRRTTTLEMGTALPEVHRTLMIETLKRDAKERGNIIEETNGDMYRIRFSQSGTAQHINEGFSAVFNGSAAFTYERPKLKPFDATLNASYSDQIDFSSFLANPSETLITYCLSFPDQETLTDGNETLISLTTDGLYQLSGETVRPNKLRPWLFALFAVIGLFVLWIILTGPVRKALIQKQRNKRRQVSKKYPAKKKSSTSRKSQTRRSGSSPTGKSGSVPRRPQQKRPGKTSGSKAGSRNRSPVRKG